MVQAGIGQCELSVTISKCLPNSREVVSVGQVQAQLAAQSLRPRLTGLLRARLYPPEKVHFDVEHEHIERSRVPAAANSMP